MAGSIAFEALSFFPGITTIIFPGERGKGLNYSKVTLLFYVGVSRSFV